MSRVFSFLLSQITNPDGTIQRVSYNIPTNTTTVTDERGNQIRTVYTSFGRPSRTYIREVGEPEQLVIEMFYDRAGRPWETRRQIDERQYVVETVRYDISSRVENVTTRDNLRHILQNVTYEFGVSNVRDGAFYPTTTTITSVGDSHFTPPVVEITTNYLGQNIREQIRETNGREIVTNTFEFDLVGNLLESRTGEAAQNMGWFTTRTAYNFRGQPIRQYHPNGNGAYVETIFDSIGRPVEQIDFMGNSTINTFDALGRIVRTVAPFDRGITREILFFYDDNGNLTQQRTQNNLATSFTRTHSIVRFEYDERNRLTAQISYDGGTRIYTQYLYDDAGNILKVATGMTSRITDWNAIPAYARVQRFEDYNMFGSPGRIIDALGQVETITYNLMQLPTIRIDRNGVRTLIWYNAHGLPMHILADNEPQIVHTYNMHGLLTSSTFGDDVTSFTYDRLGNIYQKNQNGVINTYTHDLNGNRVNFTMNVNNGVGPNQISQRFEYDRTGALERVYDLLQSNSAPIMSYSYNLNGQLTEKRVGSRIQTEIRHNAAGLITSYTIDGITSSSNFVYTHFLDGNIESITDTRTGFGTTRFTYDTMGRLTSEVDPRSGTTTTFGFDNFGNRESREVINTATGVIISTTSYDFDLNNRLLQTSTTTGSLL